ncbi:MAG: sigma-70 family RNA polymerase sigma factor [Planctomycetes bacterium]|nr:sigma-70 family RNA polymerase sigma factor [Planctomycetota bacterium]MCB9887400.1 sigma-70 family RNA polymerase sigma factor [Planctomycetota bacterium]
MGSELDPRRAAAIDSAALSRRIAAGDEAAFTAFYEHWFAPTLALARAASRRDESFCLDVVHEVMLTVARKLPGLADEAAVAAWLGTVVFRRVTDQVRQEQRRRRREQDATAGADELDRYEPWLGLAAAERQRWLGARLEEMDETDRALLLARFGDGASVVAVGSTLGLGADAAHGRLRRALSKLRQKAAEWWHVE